MPVYSVVHSDKQVKQRTKHLLARGRQMSLQCMHSGSSLSAGIGMLPRRTQIDREQEAPAGRA